jgi:serine/threonine protein kinase
LDEFINAQQAPISSARAQKLMTQIVEAFVYAHKNGIIHRDVKPSNFIITSADEIKVLDFGIAKLVGEGNHNLTKTGTQIGTVYYMSPEQVRGQVLDHRSDIYSLGVTFYELLTGVCPYKTMTAEYEIFDHIVNYPLMDLSQTMGMAYKPIWKVIEKGTAKDVNLRFENATQLMEALNGDVSHVDIPFNHVQSSHTASNHTVTQQKSNVFKIIALSLIGVAIIGGMAIYFVVSAQKNVESSNPEQQPVENQVNGGQNQGQEQADNQANLDDAQQEFGIDYENQIRGFLQAEDNRDFDAIYSYFAPEIIRYWTFNNPSYDKLKREYTSSWNRSEYSQNHIEQIEKVTDNSYIVFIDFEFKQYSKENPSHVASELKFVFTDDGKISELYSIK